jgi:hypothetical protein
MKKDIRLSKCSNKKIIMKYISLLHVHTDKKENKVFQIYQEIQRGAVANSHITNGLLTYGEIFAHFLIY